MTRQHAQGLSRRHFCLCGAASATFAATGGWLTPREAYAQARAIPLNIKAAAANAEIAVVPLRRNISVLQGSGGNVAVLTGADGKILIDAGIAVSRPRMSAALDSLRDAPITHLINTHWHFDHANGNEWVNAAGAKITAHENTRTRLSSAQYVADWITDFPPPGAGGIPTEVFSDEHSLKLNDTTLALKYYGPAHTDGDISVYFTEADVLHTGDTLWNSFYPFIDYSTGGSIDGSIAAANANLAMTTDATIVVPGHGSIGNRADLVAFRDMLVGVRDNVAALKRQGRSIEDIIAARPSGAFDPKFGNTFIDPVFFTRLVYEGV